MIPREELQIECLTWGNGQHVGTRTGVKITHLPTGIVAICETERSQHRNRQIAEDMILGGITSKWMNYTQPKEPTK